MVSLGDDVGRTVRSYVRKYPGFALARFRDDASIALGREDWSRFQLLERAKRRMLRLQYLAGRYPDTIAGEAAACAH